jgi:fructan beta-fructosidase
MRIINPTIHMRYVFFIAFIATGLWGCGSNGRTNVEANPDTVGVALYNEPYRPQVHFTPKEKWMNDPNGMVYYKGEYHLFYQHYPEGLVWGPMHWGHAVSTDLVHWTHLPIALYPDSLGLIFSGSAVVDEKNTSGFGTVENPPLVAIYTYHSQEKEKAGRTDYQNQGIAFSVDSGRTWTKYDKNPALRNQGIKDFRDPKVFWHSESHRWVMILAVSDHVELWASPNLKEWSKLSGFGVGYGAHGGVWECPDLFQLPVQGESAKKWVMLVSINPGGPNGGSATQYFVGEFDGKVFKPDAAKSDIAWMDYGPDNYAGVTWSNVSGGRKIFLGWMNNWAYAQELPTSTWRGAATCPRDFSLVRTNGKLYLASSVSPEFVAAAQNVPVDNSLQVNGTLDLSDKVRDVSKSVIKGAIDAKDFTIRLGNKSGGHLAISFDAAKKQFIIDRGAAGKIDFSKNYPTELSAPRLSNAPSVKFTVVADVSSVEVFFDDGLTVMTSTFFVDEPLIDLTIESKEAVTVQNFSVSTMNSIWQ